MGDGHPYQSKRLRSTRSLRQREQTPQSASTKLKRTTRHSKQGTPIVTNQMNLNSQTKSRKSSRTRRAKRHASQLEDVLEVGNTSHVLEFDTPGVANQMNKGSLIKTRKSSRIKHNKLHSSQLEDVLEVDHTSHVLKFESAKKKIPTRATRA